MWSVASFLNVQVTVHYPCSIWRGRITDTTTKVSINYVQVTRYTARGCQALQRVLGKSYRDRTSSRFGIISISVSLAALYSSQKYIFLDRQLCEECTSGGGGVVA